MGRMNPTDRLPGPAGPPFSEKKKTSSDRGPKEGKVDDPARIMGIRPDRPDRVGETQPKPKHRAFLGQSRPEFLSVMSGMAS